MDWRTGHRTEDLYFRMFGTDGTELGRLDGVESCSLDGSIFADVRWSGRLRWSGPGVGQQVVVPPIPGDPGMVEDPSDPGTFIARG